MAAKLEGPQQLLLEELQDIYDAEKQLVRALPKMAKAASDEELGNALRQHLEVTKGQVQRLEQIFQSMDMRARSRPCKGMKGIVEEGQEMLQEGHEEGLLDSAIAGSARKVEHYEMAAYESMRGLAKQLGLQEAAQLLEETLREEVETDRMLSQISKRLLKQMRPGASRQEEGGESGSGSRRGASGSRSSRGASSRSSSNRSSSGRSSSGGSSSGGSSSGGSSSSGSTSGRSTSGGSTSGRSSGRRSSARSEGGHAARPMTDHEEIRQWAEERGAAPACVRGTGGKGDTGMIRLDFPGFSGEESLEHISWDDWFEKFDERKLALIVQDTTASGQESNFNKLVSRERVKSGRKPRTRSAH